jgi:hypothetical protein
MTCERVKKERNNDMDGRDKKEKNNDMARETKRKEMRTWRER